MATQELPQWFPIFFPVFFLGMWVATTTTLGAMSGWFNLRQWYPDDGGEEPLLKLRGQSGSMGIGVALNGVLQLRAYPSGLGVRIWPIFGLFQKALRIPWSEIEAEPSSSFFVPMVKLHLGKPENGTLKISARSWSRLVEAVPKTGGGRQFQMPVAAPVTAGSFARALFIQWAVMIGAAGVFFYFAARTTGPGNALPIGLWIGFFAIALGIGQLVRYAREG